MFCATAMMDLFKIISLLLFFSSIYSLRLHNKNVTEQLSVKYKIEWFEQKVDHFSYTNNDTFKQRYIISFEHWKPNGPIWFYAGNEGNIFTFANNTGFIWENAKDFHAMIIFMEHRYYGQSMPYGKKSFQGLNNLGWLTVEQALADYANFLNWIKMKMAKKSPVVVIGGSYGGMLATWFRMKYPHLTVGAFAASAPILQFPDMYNCEGYNRIVTKDFEGYSSKCSDSIRNSWKAIRRIAKTNDGLKKLKEIFSLCKPLTEETIDTFIDWLSDIWRTIAMIDYPNPADFIAPLPAYPIKMLCQYLIEPDAEDQVLVKQITKAVSVFTNYTGEISCNDIEPKDDRLGFNGWSFQACTEMVLPICADGVHDMFEKTPWNFTTYSNNCKERFGIHSEKYKAFILFGGDHIKSVSNIIFSNGLRDPWSAGGILESLSDTLISIKIPGACHHEDLRGKQPNDPQILLDVRKKELSIIKGWLEKYYQENKIQFIW